MKREKALQYEYVMLIITIKQGHKKVLHLDYTVFCCECIQRSGEIDGDVSSTLFFFYHIES